MTQKTAFSTRNPQVGFALYWSFYVCSSCSEVVMSVSWPYTPGKEPLPEVARLWPEPHVVAEEIPERAAEYLRQTLNSRHAPSGAIMLCASSVDAMLKDKGYREGSLYSRIEKATIDNLITSDMREWAHEVRLGANEQRHDDEDLPLPTRADAERSIAFVTALGQLLYVLPAMVKRGRSLPAMKD